ncbi:hypothetical protein BC629DRAFT_1593296 [Irpex lacteus]|nr:hypothetical protein BC629DRAFT_1593296 [Irpex lacteus]
MALLSGIRRRLDEFCFVHVRLLSAPAKILEIDRGPSDWAGRRGAVDRIRERMQAMHSRQGLDWMIDNWPDMPWIPPPFTPHSSGSSVPRVSHPYDEDYSYAYQGQRYASPHHLSGHHDPNTRPGALSSLQISTDTQVTQEQEVDEQTAHPSRMQSQLQRIETPELPSSLAEAEPQASGSISRRASPSPSASGDGSVSNITSFGNFEDSLSRPLSLKERELLAHLDRLKFFLATAPSRWSMEGGGDASAAGHNPSALPVGHPNSAHPALNRFLLPNSEYVSCVLWGGLYHITGTDIVRALVFRFEAFGRPVKNMKKFEEGVFSDLRNLKPGVDACLEEPKVLCAARQAVPDALERDLKREKMGMEPTTVITGEPALSFTYDPKRSLYDQFSKATGVVDGEGELERRASLSDAELSSSEADEGGRASDVEGSSKQPKPKSVLHGPNSPFFSMFSLVRGLTHVQAASEEVPKHRSPSVMDMYTNGGASDGGASADLLRQCRRHHASSSGRAQIDRYGRDIARLSAADMFMAQARGDFGPQSNPDLIASQKERQRRAMQAGPLAGRHQHQINILRLRASPEAASGVVYPGPSPLGLERADGGGRRVFEQRHTYPMVALNPDVHTMRGPTHSLLTLKFAAHLPGRSEMSKSVCWRWWCAKDKGICVPVVLLWADVQARGPAEEASKNSHARETSLEIHMRAHQRADEGSGAMTDDADVESEGVDEFGNTAMCEVEVQGDVQEVHGSEEGLLMPASNLVNPIPIPIGNTVVDEPSPEQAQYIQESPNQWNMLRSHPSPAFSTISMPSPNLSASFPGVNDFTSMSAPAHKAAFDHANIYPPLGELAGGPGPIRRHRSATPSMRGYNETARRSYTDGSATRSYHPYAMHSADSSPMAYNVPLGYEASPQMVSLSRSSSHSRSSSASGHHLQDQMNQMLNLDQLDPEPVAPAYPTQAAAPGYGDLYRTDSPMQFAGATNTFDANSQEMFPMSLEDQQQHQQQPHPHQISALDPVYFGHHTTL